MPIANPRGAISATAMATRAAWEKGSKAGMARGSTRAYAIPRAAMPRHTGRIAKRWLRRLPTPLAARSVKSSTDRVKIGCPRSSVRCGAAESTAMKPAEAREVDDEAA